MKKKRFFISLFALSLLTMTSSAQVLFDGKKPAVDNLTNTWLLSVPKSAFGTDYTMPVTLDTTTTQITINGEVVTDSYTFTEIQPGASYHICEINGTDTTEADIQFTYWPVLQLYGDLSKTPYVHGRVIYTHPDSVSQEDISSRLRWAGSSTAEKSRHKHSFHLKFYNEDGSKKNMSFFGLRKDFHWRLDAGQIDFSRVRNRVAKDIWAEFASAPYYAAIEPKTPRNYVRGDFVEVFLNDNYNGIYCLNEHMDRQQLKLKPYDYDNKVFHGGLWKAMQVTMTTYFKLCPTITPTQKNWIQFFVKYPNIDDVNPTNFQTLRDIMYNTMHAGLGNFVKDAKRYYDVPVFRDYYLFVYVVGAIDNVGKNIYYACYDVESDPRLTPVIWDLDCTQGQFWSNEGSNYHHALTSPEFNSYDHLKEHLVFQYLCESDSSFHGLATERYWQLRNTTFSPDSIIARYEAYFNDMKSSGADRREITRWSHDKDLGYYELNFDNELEYLRDWWTRRIAYLDNNIFTPYPKGDVNFDRTVDIDDIADLIGYLLSISDREINTYKADRDENGTIDVDDVAAIIDEILSVD